MTVRIGELRDDGDASSAALPPEEQRRMQMATPSLSVADHSGWSDGAGKLVAISVYASREDVNTLATAVASIASASEGLHVRIDVVVNGADGLANALAALLGSDPQAGGTELAVWSLRLGDKAHAWNEYLHRISPKAETFVFMDGYAVMAKGAIASLVQALASSNQALAATGRPLSGRSAANIASQMQQRGGLHGNLFALKTSMVDELRRIGFRLPLGQYRGDSALSGVAALGANVLPRAYLPTERLLFVDGARWRHRPLRWWRLGDLRSQYRRMLRQKQGLIENAAFSDLFHDRGSPFEEMPRTVEQLVAGFVQRCPAKAASMARSDRYVRRLLLQLAHPRDWSLAACEPVLVHRTVGYQNASLQD